MAKSVVLCVAVVLVVLVSLSSGQIDYYSVLELDRSATAQDVKKAFRSLSKKHHPDHGGDRDKFQTIQEAYDVLKDYDKRTYYDRHGVAPDGTNRGGPRGNQGFRGFHQQPRAEPIKSDARTFTVKEFRKHLSTRSMKVIIVQLYSNHFYDCRMYARTWESLIKGKMKHLVDFYRVDTWKDEDILHELELSSIRVPSLIALVGKEKYTLLPDDAALRQGGELAGVREAEGWISGFYEDAVKQSATVILPELSGGVYKWAQSLKVREIGVLVYPAIPEDEIFLRALVSRTRQREINVALINSRDSVLAFLYSHCPKLSRNEISDASESREFVMIFNRSDLCEVSIVKTSRSLKIERVLPFLEYHRVIPPLTSGRCGQAEGQDELCLVYVLPEGYTSSSAVVEPDWAESLRNHLGPFQLYHVSPEEEPAFMSQFSLLEAHGSRRPRFNDLVFIAYLGMEAQNYGIIRVPFDSNLEDRLEQKVPGTLQQFLHGQKMQRGKKDHGDVMDSLVEPSFPISFWKPYYLMFNDLPFGKTLIFLAFVYMMRGLFGLAADGANNNGNNNRNRNTGGRNGNAGRQQQQQQQQQSSARNARPSTGAQQQQQTYADSRSQQQRSYQQQQSQARAQQGGGAYQRTNSQPQGQQQQSAYNRRPKTPPQNRPATPPRTRPQQQQQQQDSSSTVLRGLPVVTRTDLTGEDFDGFVILVFIPNQFCVHHHLPFDIDIPQDILTHRKIRVRSVGTNQEALWRWLRKEAEKRRILVSDTRVTHVGMRPKSNKAVIRSQYANQSSREWVNDMFQGNVILDISFQLTK